MGLFVRYKEEGGKERYSFGLVFFFCIRLMYLFFVRMIVGCGLVSGLKFGWMMLVIGIILFVCMCYR